MIMNKNRLMAGTLTAAVIVANTGLSAVRVYAAENNSEKEEVVYVITDASGKTDSVNVVNIFGKGRVTDYGDYSKVKMLNTTDDISQDSDKITFTTDKDKVYYQGTLDDAQIPWNIEITYKLDGISVLPEELAGKSGKLEINISITENKKCTTGFYDQFALQAAFTLDTEKCKNIKADGATLANVGADKQISYTVLPKKGLSAQITADVTDFEMDAASINGVKLDLNMEIDDSELMEKVNQIQDAAKELNDGATQLSDGNGKLKTGSGSLMDGAEQLSTATSSLDNGISDLDSGVNEMQKALDTLNSKSDELTGGSDQVLDALKNIQTQLSAVSVSTEQLKQLTDSSSAIKQGITEAYNGASDLQDAVSYDSYMNTLNSKGLDVVALSEKNEKAIENLSAQIDDVSKTIEQIKSIPGYESDEAYAAQVAQLESSIENMRDIIALLKGNDAAIDGTKQYLDSTNAGVSQLVNGLSDLKKNYEAFDSAINDMADTLSGMVVKVSTLKSGINQLVDSYSVLDDGVNQYTDSVASIVAAYSKIVDGTGALASGSKNIVEGSQALTLGSIDLYNGLSSLDDGSKQLLSGADDFYSETADMDTQVQDQIDSMIDEISGGDEPVVSFVSDKNTNIDSVQFVIKTSAIQKEEAEQKTTQEKEKKSLWEKFIDLF